MTTYWVDVIAAPDTIHREVCQAISWATGDPDPGLVLVNDFYNANYETRDE